MKFFTLSYSTSSCALISSHETDTKNLDYKLGMQDNSFAACQAYDLLLGFRGFKVNRVIDFQNWKKFWELQKKKVNVDRCWFNYLFVIK